MEQKDLPTTRDEDGFVEVVIERILNRTRFRGKDRNGRGRGDYQHQANNGYPSHMKAVPPIGRKRRVPHRSSLLGSHEPTRKQQAKPPITMLGSREALLMRRRVRRVGPVWFV